MPNKETIVARYYPEIFDVPDLERAKEIILTNEGPGADSETRWAIETPYVIELMAKAFALTSRTIVLDYGCGVGRLAKAMIEASGCAVIGVDISARMRQLAIDYVASDRFIALSPSQFDLVVGGGLRVDAAVAVWVLQHSLAPAADITRIRSALTPHAAAFVLNMPKRAVPVVIERTEADRMFTWAHDSVDVEALLRDLFDVAAEGQPDMTRVPNMADAGAYWLALRPKTAELSDRFSALSSV